MMDDYKVSDNSYGVEDRKTISPHHSHTTNGVRPSDSNGIVSALEMNKDTKSAWCLSLVPIEVWRRKRQNGGFDYKLSITVINFDKHPTLKDTPEIPIKNFIGKTVEYNPYGN